MKISLTIFGKWYILDDETSHFWIVLDYNLTKIDEPFFCMISTGGDDNRLSVILDAICVMKLDHGLHQDAGVFTEICDTEYFLN